MKRIYFFFARALVVLLLLVTAFFTIRVIQTVQAESHNEGGSGASNLNLAYPAKITLGVSIVGTGSGAEIVISSPGGIDCGDTCSFGFTQDSKVKLVAGSSSPDVIFEQWIVDGVPDTTNDLLVVTMDKAHQVFAVFNSKSQPKNYLTVSRVGSSTAKVTSQPAGINCGQACGALFSPGSSVTLTAVPGAFEKFDKWVVNGVDVLGEAPLTLTMDTNQNVLAVFSSVYTSRGDLVVNLTGGRSLAAIAFDYTVTVTNKGPDTATGATVTESVKGDGENESWTCTGSGGATCPATGSGALSGTVTIPPNGVVTYTIHRWWSVGSYTYTVTANPPAGMVENVPADNSKSLSGYIMPLPIILRP